MNISLYVLSVQVLYIENIIFILMKCKLLKYITENQFPFNLNITLNGMIKVVLSWKKQDIEIDDTAVSNISLTKGI